MFEIMIQLGAILAVVFYYRNRILDYIEKYLFSPFTVSIALILGADIILLVE